jgi:hypothetical protein
MDIVDAVTDDLMLGYLKGEEEDLGLFYRRQFSGWFFPLAVFVTLVSTCGLDARGRWQLYSWFCFLLSRGSSGVPLMC